MWLGRRPQLLVSVVAAPSGRTIVQDLIWIGVSFGFILLSLVYVALADRA